MNFQDVLFLFVYSPSFFINPPQAYVCYRVAQCMQNIDLLYCWFFFLLKVFKSSSMRKNGFGSSVALLRQLQLLCFAPTGQLALACRRAHLWSNWPSVTCALIEFACLVILINFNQTAAGLHFSFFVHRSVGACPPDPPRRGHLWILPFADSDWIGFVFDWIFSYQW